MNPIEFAKSSLNDNIINKTSKWLREIDELEKLAFIWKVLETNEYLGLRLVKSSQLASIHLQVIFERGLVYSDASSINVWMKTVINGLGHKKLLKIIRSHISKTPLGVYKTFYWLPSLYENQSNALKDEIKEIMKEFNKIYPDFSTTRSIGSHPCTEKRIYLDTNGKS